MELISGFAVLVAATFITAWYNDNVSTADYISDEA